MGGEAAAEDLWARQDAGSNDRGASERWLRAMLLIWRPRRARSWRLRRERFGVENAKVWMLLHPRRSTKIHGLQSVRLLGSLCA